MFVKIVGHEKEKKYFENVIKNNELSHAYLFYGKEGVGKSLFAKELAKIILSTDNLDSCLDYKYICKNDDKKDLVIEQIRKDVIDGIYTAPISGKYKVYIIDDAQYLNVSAQNALLKTLEEPPIYVFIILIASITTNILPTISSRVNKISFDKVETKDIEMYIENKYNKKLNSNMLRYIDGSIGIATQIIEEGLENKFSDIDKLYETLNKKDTVESLILSQKIEFSNKFNLGYLEYLLYQNGKYETIKYVNRAIYRLKFNGNYEIVIDNMILKIIENI